jgi:archaellum component FlaC
MEKLIIDIPNKTDVKFLSEIISRLGFKVERVTDKLNRFVEKAPKNVPISDAEIIAEIKEVRKNRAAK